jgi:hypothetical protein
MANVEQLWGVYEARGVEDVERVRAAADRMVAQQHAWGTRNEYAYAMRQLANRFMRRFETAEFEYAQYVGRSIEAIVAGDAERSGLDVSHYERGFMAMHAMSYAVLRRLCVEPPSPVFGADGTIRVGRVLADDAELRGESSLRVLSTGSSPYRVFRCGAALGVGRGACACASDFDDCVAQRRSFISNEIGAFVDGWSALAVGVRGGDEG